ncbi:MAG: hypothetical protein WC430_01955 [Patescibacteria group bacterium]
MTKPNNNIFLNENDDPWSSEKKEEEKEEKEKKIKNKDSLLREYAEEAGEDMEEGEEKKYN